MDKRIYRVLILLAITAASIGFDQSTKLVAKSILEDHGTVGAIGNVLILRYTRNSGAFLGLGSAWPAWLRFFLLTFLSSAVLLVLIIYLLNSKTLYTAQVVAFSLVIGGGLSNIIDRLMYDGLVIDFLNLGIGRVRTGIFNLADVFILSGISVFILFRKKIPKKT